jgi:hypothetical protein
MEVYILSNKGFWDEEGYYFNREGYDKHGKYLLIKGGYYDDNFEYVHGKGWDSENQYYRSQLEEEEYLDGGDNGI